MAMKIKKDLKNKYLFEFNQGEFVVLYFSRMQGEALVAV